MTCPLCGKTGDKLLHRVPKARGSAHRRAFYRVVRCEHCGFAYVSDPPDSSQVTALYDRSFFSSSQQALPVNEAGTLAPSYRSTAVYRNAERRVRLLRQYRDSGRLLDVGCGNGGFLLAAADTFPGLGVDISEDACSFVKRVLGFETICGDFLTADFEGSSFDVVTMWDVLAGTGDPKAWLSKVNSLLKPGAVLALTVPDVGSLCARAMGRHWHLMIPPIVVSFFTETTLRDVLQRTGFEVLYLKRPGKYVSLAFLIRKLARIAQARRYDRAYRASLLKRAIYVNLRDIMTVVARKTAGREEAV